MYSLRHDNRKTRMIIISNIVPKTAYDSIIYQVRLYSDYISCAIWYHMIICNNTALYTIIMPMHRHCSYTHIHILIIIIYILSHLCEYLPPLLCAVPRNDSPNAHARVGARLAPRIYNITYTHIPIYTSYLSLYSRCDNNTSVAHRSDKSNAFVVGRRA